MTATQLVIVLVAVIIGSVAKAVTGMGLPVIAIPIAALFVDIDTAVVVIAFPNVLATSSRSATGMAELRAAMAKLLEERSK